MLWYSTTQSAITIGYGSRLLLEKKDLRNIYLSPLYLYYFVPSSNATMRHGHILHNRLSEFPNLCPLATTNCDGFQL